MMQIIILFYYINCKLGQLGQIVQNTDNQKNHDDPIGDGAVVDDRGPTVTAKNILPSENKGRKFYPSLNVRTSSSSPLSEYPVIVLLLSDCIAIPLALSCPLLPPYHKI